MKKYVCHNSKTSLTIKNYQTDTNTCMKQMKLNVTMEKFINDIHSFFMESL